MGYMPVPEPSGEMQANFNAMLESYKAEAEMSGRPARGFGRPARTGAGGFWQLFRVQPWLVTAFSLILIAGGFGLGYMLNRSPQVIYVAAKASEKAPETVLRPASPSPAVLKPPKRKPVKADAATASQVQALSEQLREMRQMMMLSLLQNPSASERMRAAS